MNNDTLQPTVKESLTVQKPRCPYPVHEWPKEAALAVHYQKWVYFRDVNNVPQGCIFVGGKHQEEPINYTRAEALASQWLDKPDKTGVWVIYEKHATPIVDEIKDLTLTPHYDEYDGTILFESIRGRWSFYSVNNSKFYYMGPLPESEVCHG